MLIQRRILSIFLMFTFIITLFNGIYIPQGKADELITLAVDKDSNLQDKITDTEVVLKWNQVYGAKSYLISYIDYIDDNTGVAKCVYVDNPTLTYNVTNIVPDIIYNFTVEAKTELNGLGTTFATDQLKVITSSTFSTTYLPDEVVQNNYERESGVSPGLKLQWNIPKMWDGTKFDSIGNSLLDYKVTIGTDTGATNSGTYKVKFNGSNYEVFKENVPTDVKLSYAPVSIANGRLAYEWRYKNPITEEIVDATVKSGTIYYMNLIPQFNAGIGKIKYRISPLKSGYTYSPLHIKVGKDSNNNIICTIYRINYDTNQGSSKINFKYEVYSSPDATFASPTLEGYEFEQYGEPTLPIEIFIPQKDQTSTFYYMALAKSDGMHNLESPIVDYNMAMDAGRPSIPQNVSVAKTELVSKMVNGENIKSANITLKWDKPTDFEYSKENMDYYILLSSNQADITTAEGVYYKEIIDNNEYDIKYRAIKVVNGASSNIDLSEIGYLKYTLNGFELFTKDDSTPIQNNDNYPEELQLNKIYYLKLYSKRSDTGIVSDYSIPISFTTPASSIRKPPVPEMFNADKVTSDEIRMAWQKTEINLTDYGAVGADYSVYYEVYMNDTIQKDATGNYIKPFVYIGGTNNPLHVLFNSGTGNYYNVRYATVKEFLGNNDVTARFGNKIKPNTSYYFIIRTKLVIVGQTEPRYSDFSQLLPITTLKGEIVKPGDNEKTPESPIDFSIEVDSNGNRKLDSYSSSFTWTKRQDNVGYRIVRTLKPINASDEIEKIQIQPGVELTQYYIPDTTVPNSVGKYVYGVQELWPNTVYFFSIRAERQILEDGQTRVLVSPWITLPVTTYMVESPDTFELMRDGTYDRYRQLKVKWRAKEYFNFEVWIRAEGQDQYINWSSVNISNEKPKNLKDTSFKMYYGVISGLQSSTKYYIKIRNKTSRVVNSTTINDYSKFVGPTFARTEFSQVDYDQNEQLKEEELVFLDMIKTLKDEIFWTLTNTESQTQIKLRSSKIINASKYDNSDRFVIDLTGFKNKSTKKIVLIPLDLVNYINSNKELLVLKSEFGEMVLKPGTIDSVHQTILDMKNKIGLEGSVIKDIYIRINIQNINTASTNISAVLSNSLVSDVTGFSIDVLGISDKEENIESLVSQKFAYISTEKLSYLKARSMSEKDTTAELEALINNYIESSKSELALYIDTMINGSWGYIKEVKNMPQLTKHLQFRYQIKTVVPSYTQLAAYYYKDNRWEKVATIVDSFNSIAVFDIRIPSNVAVFSNSGLLGNINDKNKAEQLNQLNSKYDILGLITENGTFNGQQSIVTKQMLAVIAKVLGEEIQNESEIITKVSKRLELSNKITLLSESHKLTNEQAAYIVLKLYVEITGMSLESLKPSRAIYLTDAKQIDPVYYRTVIMAVDLKLILPDNANRINPSNTISKEDALIMLNKVLNLTGK